MLEDKTPRTIFFGSKGALAQSLTGVFDQVYIDKNGEIVFLSYYYDEDGKPVHIDHTSGGYFVIKSVLHRTNLIPTACDAEFIEFLTEHTDTEISFDYDAEPFDSEDPYLAPLAQNTELPF